MRDLLMPTIFFRVTSLASIALLFSLNTDAQPIDFSDCANCSSAQIALHTEIKDKYLGVSGINPSRPSTYNLIGTNKLAGGLVNIGDIIYENVWHPIRTRKQILVGTALSFFITRAGDESDWNIHISHDPSFEGLMTSALSMPYKNLNDWGAPLSENKYTIEAELTPVKSAFNNPWFNNVTHKSTLTGKRIAAYGPFVAERAHGYKPEIHPSEQIWWKENENSTIMILAGDASNRFDEMSDYDANYADPGYQPWTQDRGQEAELSIPFEVNPSGGSLAYTLYSLWGENSFFSEANYNDASGGTTHTISYNGRQVLTILESETVERYIGVTFRDVCFDNSRSMLKGYIVLTTATGNGGGGREGFVVLRLDKTNYSFQERPGIIIGDIVNASNTANTWTSFTTLAGNTVPFSDDNIISSDKYGRGTVDGIIDFNGNGLTDVFAVSNNRWLVLYDGKGEWQEINRSNVPLKDLRFGDINDDGITDVLHVNSAGRVEVSMRGVQRWQDITDAGEQTKDIRVGDFNGDNRTDIVYMKFMETTGTFHLRKGVYNMYVKYGSIGNWQALNTGYELKMSGLELNGNGGLPGSDDYHNNWRFGNFDGDNTTDIFRYYNNKFMVYWDGRGNMQELCSPLVSNYNMNEFLFVDNLSRSGYTDVIYVKRSTGAWKFYYEGTRITEGRLLKYSNPSTVHFGNLDGNALWEPFVAGPVRQTGLPSEFAFPPVNSVRAEPFAMITPEEGSIRRTMIDGRPVLSADMKVEYHAGASGAVRKREDFQNVVLVKEKLNARGLSYTANNTITSGNKILGKIKNARFGTKENKIELKFAGISTPVTYEIRACGIDAVPHRIVETINGTGDWNLWKTFLPGIKPLYSPLLTAAPATVEKVKAIEFGLYPLYSSKENGKVTLVEMGDLVKELNAIAYGTDTIKTREIFGNTSVFSIQWQFELKNLSTGMVIPITDPPVLSNGRWRNDKLSYSFPEQNGLLRLKAVATIEDNLGNISRILPIFFYNQRLRFSDIKTQLGAWLEKIKTAAGKQYEYITRHFYHLSDNSLTPEELKVLLK